MTSMEQDLYERFLINLRGSYTKWTKGIEPDWKIIENEILSKCPNTIQITKITKKPFGCKVFMDNQRYQIFINKNECGKRPV